MLIVLAFTTLMIVENYKYADYLALLEAKTSIKKDLTYRMWGASHGGVYVPIDKRTQPNPYLAHIPNRDIETQDGMKLTLMNPAYMLSQMMREYSTLYGTKGHITSKMLLNPSNNPDEWELKALNTIEKTNKPVYGKTKIEKELYYRYLKPLVTEKSCLKCHAFQGYKEGDIRGGISVSIPMKPYNQQALERSTTTILFSLFILIFGLSLIIFGRKKAKDILFERIKAYEQNIYSLVTMIEKRDRFTAGHTQRVAKYALLIAKQIGYNEDVISELHTACILHDIGKISTPDSILLKPGSLTHHERKIIEEHVVTGYEILKGIDIYRDIAEIIRHHHERYDGSGYPQKLKGEQIPKLSQIIAIADTFDSMTTDRIYKNKISVATAIEELKSVAGKQFNVELVTEAIIALKDIEIEKYLAQTPQNRLEKERFSYFYKDQIVDGYNRDYLIYIMDRNSLNNYQYKYAYIIYLHNFSHYNKVNGWIAGDTLLKNFAQEIDKTISNKLLFRIYGDDFIILTEKKSELASVKNRYEIFFEDKDITLTIREIDLEKNLIRTFKQFESYITI